MYIFVPGKYATHVDASFHPKIICIKPSNYRYSDFHVSIPKVFVPYPPRKNIGTFLLELDGKSLPFS